MDSRKKNLTEALRKKVFLNSQVSNKELIELLDLFIERKYHRNKMLVMEGETWDKVFYIHQGILRLFYMDNKGREFNKGFYWEDQLAWPIAPSAQKEDSLFNIAALEDIVVSVCPFDLFQSWLIHHGYWEKFALPYVEAFVEQKFAREHEFLLNSATERFHKFCTQYPQLVNRIPDYHLASYIGISNVSLSRIKSSIDFNLC